MNLLIEILQLVPVIPLREVLTKKQFQAAKPLKSQILSINPYLHYGLNLHVFSFWR